MAKIDTVNKYLAEFLEGRRPEYCEKFKQKSIDNQYASIASWRRRNRLKAELKESSGYSAAGILESLRTLRKKAVDLQDITEKETERIRKELALFDESIVNHTEIRKQRALEELERQAEAINARIAELKGL